MFQVIENGTLVEIPDNCFGFNFKCWIPPIGYGLNAATLKLEQVDVIKRSDIPEEQYWERPQLPADFNLKRKKEAERQKFDPLFVNQELESFRIQEWRRRLCGCWFWNYNPYKKESEVIHIVGVHYFMLTYWKFQGKWFDFRMPDRDYWYVVKYCEEDPCCLGLNELTKRKNGKTARAGCWLYERTSRMENHHGGIQSKADDDAQEVIKKGVIHPWKTLPHFFRPIYDTMKGDDPSEELRFFHASRRGSSAETEQDEEALNSFIDFKPSAESAYDGPELHTYVSDESGKTKKPVSILERQNVVRYCTEIDGEFKGKHLFTTTVEPEKGEPENYEFQDLTAQSNPLERDENGRTGTGLYTIFLPAHKAMFFDKYGYADEERAKEFLLNTRKKYQEENNTRKLSSFKRKNPMSFKEAFSADGEFALYDPEKLNNQLDLITWQKELTEKGNLEWKNGEPFKLKIDRNGQLIETLNEIIWVPCENGRWEKVKGWWPKDPNKVFENNGQFLPNNNFAMRIGCDPFKYDKTKDKRRSMCCAFAFQMKDALASNDIYNDAFVLKYSFRRDSTREANDDVLKMAWLCGCQVLFERNVNHWKEYFKEMNCAAFLMYLPGEQEPGIYTDGQGNTTQLICNYTESYINNDIGKVLFKSLIRKDTGWLGFKVEDTQIFDEPMAAGFTLIAVKGKRYTNPIQQRQNIEDIMPYHTMN